MIALSRTSSVVLARIGLGFFFLSFLTLGVWECADLRGQAPARKKPRVEEEEETPKVKPPPQKRRVEEEETPKAKTPSGNKKRIEEEEETPKAKTAPGKKKRIEEEEQTPKAKSKPKVIRVEEEDDPKEKSAAPSSPRIGAGGDLRQLAEQATHKEIKNLYRSLAVPHDVALFKRTPGVTHNGERKQREETIEPTPFYLKDGAGRRKRLRFTPLTDDWKRGKPFEPFLDSLQTVLPYEEIAANRVRQFLQSGCERREADDPLYLSRYDMLVVAERVLSAVLRWHESAKLTGQRSGDEWKEVESQLRKQLLDDVLLEQMKTLAAAKDWDRVLELTHRLALTYPDSADRKRIFRPVADMIRNALNDPTGNETNKQQARKRLYELEQEFPDNPAFQPISNLLIENAKSLLRRAKELAGDGSDPAKLRLAREELQRAQETWPQLPELRAFEIELGMEHPVLRVGVRGQRPRYFSPAWACTDNERRAVDLLFESLVKQIPDEAGGFRYRPGLARARPRVVPLGREFELPHEAIWSDGKPLNSTDLIFSFKLLQNGRGLDRSRVWGELLAGVESKKNPYQATVQLKQGFLDPLAPMTFKILPHHQPILTEKFAEHPVTSGPYLLDASRQSDERNRPCTIFAANRAYGLRPTKRSTPHIQEIRFYTYTNAVEELSKGNLDVVLDLTAKEWSALREKQQTEGLPIEVPQPSLAVPNRRIYFLAINARKLPDVKLRRALAFAINREGLLDKHFRAAPKGPPHCSLYGPFPATSWACNPEVRDRLSKTSLDLYDADKARTLSQGAAVGRLTLKYPSDDPALDEAMKELCASVKELTGIVLQPTPCDAYRLREDVEQTQGYDLAYYHYDYPDESYWLSPLFGQPPGTEGEKTVFQFNNASLSSLLAEASNYRDFAKVRRYQWQLHALLNDEMPFIPLWQLDPLLAYRRAVQPVALEPLQVFANIEEWRLTAQPR